MIAALTNHLIQSTIFALATAFLVLALQKNRARVRYALWLAAALKFLIPFSMLIAIGSQIHWTPAAQAVATHAASPDVVQAVEQFSEPFTVAPQQQPAWKPFAIFWLRMRHSAAPASLARRENSHPTKPAARSRFAFQSAMVAGDWSQKLRTLLG